MVSSEDADARVLPSGLKVTLHTKSVCPVKVEGTAIESEHEIEWLAQELSNWLGIPITSS